MELSGVTRERNELSNQLSALSRKRESLNEENMRIRQRLEQASETNSRINRNLEELVKDNEEKQVRIAHKTRPDWLTSWRARKRRTWLKSQSDSIYILENNRETRQLYAGNAFSKMKFVIHSSSRRLGFFSCCWKSVTVKNQCGSVRFDISIKWTVIMISNQKVYIL